MNFAEKILGGRPSHGEVRKAWADLDHHPGTDYRNPGFTTGEITNKVIKARTENGERIPPRIIFKRQVGKVLGNLQMNGQGESQQFGDRGFSFEFHNLSDRVHAQKPLVRA